MAKETGKIEDEVKVAENDIAETTNAEKTLPGLYTKEKYKIELPLNKDDPSDVTVIVNGFVTKIQRGKEVEVSAAVYEVLKNSERMDKLAIIRQRELSE